jgi:bifunctional non-homologous end joining protein LigD
MPHGRFLIARPLLHTAPQTKEPQVAPGWIHEIKRDGFRILAHRQAHAIRLISRNDHDHADRFPLLVG